MKIRNNGERTYTEKVLLTNSQPDVTLDSSIRIETDWSQLVARNTEFSKSG